LAGKKITSKNSPGRTGGIFSAWQAEFVEAYSMDIVIAGNLALLLHNNT